MKKLILFLGITSLLGGCGNISDEVESEVAEKSTYEELTLDSFGEALVSEGYTYEEVEKEPAFIGATSGRGYDIDGNIIELYKYVDGSDIFEEIKENGFIEIEDLIAFEVEINGQYALALNEHPDSTEILEIYNNLNGSK